MDAIAQMAIIMGFIIAIISGIVRYINHKRAVSITTKITPSVQDDLDNELNLIEAINIAIKSSSFPFGFGEYKQYHIFLFPEYFIEIADNISADIETIRTTLEKLSPKMLARVKPEVIDQLLPENTPDIYEKASDINISDAFHEISFAKRKLRIESFIYNYIKERYPGSIPFLIPDTDQIVFIENALIRALVFVETTIDKTVNFFTEKSLDINKKNNKPIFDYKLQLHKYITTIAELKEISNEKIAILYACKNHETYEKDRLQVVYPAITALNEKKNIILCETRIGSFHKSELNDFLKEANIKTDGVLAVKEGKIVAFEKFAKGNNTISDKQFIPAKKILSETFNDEIVPTLLISDLDSLLNLSRKSMVLCFIENFKSECNALSSYTELKIFFTSVLRTVEKQNKIKIRWVYPIQNKEIANYLAKNEYPKNGVFLINNGKVLKHKKCGFFTLSDTKIKYATEMLDSLNLPKSTIMDKNILSNIFDCPNCGAELELEEEGRKEKKFTCPECNKFIDMNIFNSNYDERVVTQEEYECSECHADVKEEDKICPKCGANIEDEEEEYECSECHAAVKEEDKFCPECGANLED